MAYVYIYICTGDTFNGAKTDHTISLRYYTRPPARDTLNSLNTHAADERHDSSQRFGV